MLKNTFPVNISQEDVSIEVSSVRLERILWFLAQTVVLQNVPIRFVW